MRPPAASKSSSPRINARTKLTIPSFVRWYRKSLFAKVVPEETTFFAKLGGRDGQIIYVPSPQFFSKTMRQKGDIILLLLSDLKSWKHV